MSDTDLGDIHLGGFENLFSPAPTSDLTDYCTYEQFGVDGNTRRSYFSVIGIQTTAHHLPLQVKAGTVALTSTAQHGAVGNR